MLPLASRTPLPRPKVSSFAENGHDASLIHHRHTRGVGFRTGLRPSFFIDDDAPASPSPPPHRRPASPSPSPSPSPGQVTLPRIVDPYGTPRWGRLSEEPLPLPKKSMGSSARKGKAGPADQHSPHDTPNHDPHVGPNPDAPQLRRHMPQFPPTNHSCVNKPRKRQRHKGGLSRARSVVSSTPSVRPTARPPAHPQTAKIIQNCRMRQIYAPENRCSSALLTSVNAEAIAMSMSRYW